MAMITGDIPSRIMKAKEADQIISSIAMIVALVSFGMLFFTLMMSFAIYRFTAPVWPPAGMVKPSLLLPTLSTCFIFLSSLFYFSFEKKIKEGKIEKEKLQGTLFFGVLFMACQFVFWNHLKTQGIYVSSGIFASIIYAFTWIHAAHIFAALILLIYLLNNLKKTNLLTTVKVASIGKFWHFLGIVWLVMFLTIFVL